MSSSRIQEMIDAAVDGREANDVYQTVDFKVGQRLMLEDALRVQGGLTIDLHGSRLVTSSHGMVLGPPDDNDEPDLKSYDAIVKGRRGGFTSAVAGHNYGIRVCDASRAKFEDLVLARFASGITLGPMVNKQTVYDCTINDVYIRGCDIGVKAVSVNNLKISGGEYHGQRDGEIIKGSVGYWFSRCNRVDLIAPMIQRAETAFRVVNCGNVDIMGVYTEKIGQAEPFNNQSVGQIIESVNVRVNGLINGSHGSSSSATHCAIGLYIKDSQVIMEGVRFYQLRDVDVRVFGDSEVFLPLEGGYWSGTAFSKRIPIRLQRTETYSFGESIEDWDVKPSARLEEGVFKIDSFANDIPFQHRFDLSRLDEEVEVGDTLEFEVYVALDREVDLESKTGRSVFRASLGNKDREAIDVDLAFGVGLPKVKVRWVVNEEDIKTVFVGMGSRPTKTSPPEVGLFWFTVSGGRVKVIKNLEITESAQPPEPDVGPENESPDDGLPDVTAVG